MFINEKLMLVIDLLNELKIEMNSSVPQGITNQIDVHQPKLINWLQEAVVHLEETGDTGVDDGFKYSKIEEQSKKITREEFMAYFRSDAFDNQMSESDCEEVFLGSLKGQ